jgi:ABC-type Fe3+-hydroxamate transport system substrate-binding protein
MICTDQLGRTLTLNFEHSKLKIVSLVPSQTEFLFDIGLAENVVGITKFCIHPAEALKQKTIIGGTKNINIKKILELEPDIVIANKEENEQSQIEELMKQVPVWISDIYTLDDAYQMMLSLGEIFHKPNEASAIVSEIKHNFLLINSKNTGKRVAYFIWRGPYMLAGEHTFINHLLEKMGLKNICVDLHSNSRYPEIDAESLKKLNPDLIYLSSEPYPFKNKHLDELQAICPGANIQLVNGELFSWYGSRLKHTAAHMQELLSV